MSNDQNIDYNDVIKTIRDILVNDVVDADDPDKLTLYDFCENRITQGTNIFKDRIKFPKITILLEEEDFDTYSISKSFRLFTRGWIREGARNVSINGTAYANRTLAAMMDNRIKELLDKNDNIVGDKVTILQIRSVSGGIEEKIAKYQAYSKLTIFRLTVKKKA